MSATAASTGQLALDEFAAFCCELTLDSGRPMVLEPFQLCMLADYFAGTTETLILIPKKNSKSTTLAALALHHLVSTPDAECVVAAASRDQATILYDQAGGFVRRSAVLQQYVDVKRGYREVRSKIDNGRIRVLASDADTADGALPTLALVDELHRHKSADMYGVFRDGLGPRSGRMITISTAGDDEESPLGKMRRAAYELPGLSRDGAYRHACSPNGQYVMHEWSLEPDANVHDMSVVKEANPASWQDEKALARRHDSPSMTPWQWGRFACGIWMAGEDSAISPLDWAACGDTTSVIPDGESVWLGVDLGWKWDTTAIVPVWVRGDEDFVIGAPVIVVPPRDNTSTPEAQIIGPLVEMRDRWDVLGVVLDPNAGGEQLAQHLDGQYGMTVVTHSQDPAPMSLAAERLSAAVRNRGLTHPNDRDLTGHVLAAAAKSTSGEKWRLVKSSRKKNIDACIALAMALSVAIDQATATSVYESRGLLVI